MAWPSPFVAANVLTATQLNGIQAIGQAWTLAATPTWAGSTTNPVLNNGTMTSRYMQIGKTMLWEINLTIGSTTTMGTGVFYTWSLPLTVLNGSNTVAGAASFWDASASTGFARTAMLFSTTQVVLVDNAGVRVGPTTPVVPATGDIISISGVSELP